nr:hypothetical protein [Tanacetum cinerariifolium]
MRLEECAMWDLDKVTWEGRVEAMGTIHVCVCAQESWVDQWDKRILPPGFGTQGHMGCWGSGWVLFRWCAGVQYGRCGGEGILAGKAVEGGYYSVRLG